MMAFLMAAYDEEQVNDETRTVLRLHPRLAPYKIAVLPLSKKNTLLPKLKKSSPVYNRTSCAITTSPKQ